MNTNLPYPNHRASHPHGRGLGGDRRRHRLSVLLVKKLASPKVAKPEHLSRAKFCAEMLATRERFHTNHLAILEKLDANHRELLGALERLATRIYALEAGLARVDERTRK